MMDQQQRLVAIRECDAVACPAEPSQHPLYSAPPQATRLGARQANARAAWTAKSHALSTGHPSLRAEADVHVQNELNSEPERPMRRRGFPASRGLGGLIPVVALATRRSGLPMGSANLGRLPHDRLGQSFSPGL